MYTTLSEKQPYLLYPLFKFFLSLRKLRWAAWRPVLFFLERACTELAVKMVELRGKTILVLYVGKHDSCSIYGVLKIGMVTLTSQEHQLDVTTTPISCSHISLYLEGKGDSFAN